MWLPQNVIDDVDAVARIYYVGCAETALWNEHRREGELRLLTGWCWAARDGDEFRQGYKTRTVAYREAWYVLFGLAVPSIAGVNAPRRSRTALRVVAKRKAA